MVTAVHFVVEELATQKTPSVKDWLAAHPRVTIHYTPTYHSWLEQVKSWFARIECHCIARGIFASTNDLARRLLRYIKLQNEICRSVVLRCLDATLHIPASREPDTAHLSWRSALACSFTGRVRSAPNDTMRVDIPRQLSPAGALGHGQLGG